MILHLKPLHSTLHPSLCHYSSENRVGSMRFLCSVALLFASTAVWSASAFSRPSAAPKTSTYLKMSTGTVVSFNPAKGFGFIANDDGSGDVYVQHSNVQMQGYRKLKNNERVEFKTGVDTERGTGKAYAFDVTHFMEAKEELAAANDAAEVESKRLENALSKEPTRNYSSMNLGERAFNVLLDLGLVTISPDPDAPDYDHSKDNELAPENVNI